MQAGTNEYLLRPDVLTNACKKRLCKAFNSRRLDLQNREADKILKEIRHMDQGLADSYAEFFDEESCRRSFIRNALLEMWNAGTLNIKPIPVIGARPSSRLLPSEAMA
jgi:hypothetical protein